MKKWKWWQKGLAGVGLVVGLTAVYTFWPQGVWPFTVDLSELAAVGDQYDVTILRDSYGVPHIFGQTDADTAYGLGYAHSEDDFLTIQQAFVAARGKLGVAYGPEAAPNDYMVQLLRIWDVVDAKYATIPPDIQAILSGYADGLNHYAALHPDEVLLPELFPVTGQDIAAGFIHRLPLFFGLDGALGELFADERQRDVAEKGGAALIPISTRYGSNTMSISPLRTANGETFLAVNAHQPWEGIATWYEAHMHSEEGLDMVGGLLPGSPIITHGHNRDLGWAFTVNSPDLVDVYVLEINPDDPNQYRFDGEWLSLEVRDAPITVTLVGRLRWTVHEEVLWSVYGPTVRQDHGTYSIRFAGMGEISQAEQFVRMNKATSLDEWMAVMENGTLPMFNVGYADKEGNIFYVYNGLFPQRAEGYDWQQYLPGDRSETLWDSYLPFEQRPQVLNPPSGFVQNSNNGPFQTTSDPYNPNPADFSTTIGMDLGMSNRALRTLALYEADESITEAEFYAYKYDMFYAPESDVAQVVAQLLAAPTPNDAHVQQALAILAEWDLQANPESVGTTIAILTLSFVHDHPDVEMDISEMVGGVFPEQATVDGLQQAVELLMEQFGRVDVAWQDVNRLVRGDVDLGLGGAPDVLHAVYGELEDNGRFHGIAGDSYILMVTWDGNGRVRSQSIHQYGSATLDVDSPHYADQAPIFARRELTAVWFDEADIRAHLESEYQPGMEKP